MARILLIDDNDCVRKMVGLLLALSGHTVIEARDGEEGLDLFPGSAADLVITDMMMPKKGGLEVIRTLRQQQSPVPIVAISGGGPSDAEHPLDAARRLGAARVIAKPFSCAELMAAIDEVLTVETAVAVGA